MNSHDSKHSKQSAGRLKSEMSNLSKFYLIGYNGLQTLGWSYLFFQSMKYLLQNKSTVGLWDRYGLSAIVFQSLAGLEVVHAAIGLVPSNTVMTLVQVFSRVYQVWGIIYSVPEVQDSPSIGLLIFAWGLTEMIRYAYYTANLLGTKSYFLTWCRYSLFYMLYPTGVVAEISTILQALSFIKQRKLYSIMLPNFANFSFSFYYYNIFIMLTYIPLFPVLFNHMRRQRAKILGSDKGNGKDAYKKLS